MEIKIVPIANAFVKVKVYPKYILSALEFKGSGHYW